MFTVHFPCRHGPSAVLVTRYILDDKWLGSFRTTAERSSQELLLDEGRFFGVQRGTRAIGIYTPADLGAWQPCRSAKLCFVVSPRAAISELQVGGHPVLTLPCEVPEGLPIAFACGDAFLVIRLFSRTKLGREAPIRIVQRGENLVLEVYNHLGAPKTFWEVASPGSFYQGRPACGFFAEAAERSHWPSLSGFVAEVQRGAMRETTPPPVTWKSRGEPRPWCLEYARDHARLGLEVDLMEWRLVRRYNEAGDWKPPLLQSPVAAESADGFVALGGASVRAPGANLWLFGNVRDRTWVAGGAADQPVEAVLETPDGVVRVAGFRAGMMMMKGGVPRCDVLQES